MRMNKKGAEMTIGTIIIIVLALIVLVVLVLGFTGGWSNLWSRITSFFGGSNVDSIVQACQVACSTSSKYDYCDRARTVKAESAIFQVDTAGVIQQSTGQTSKEGKATCKDLASWHGSLGFTACPALC